MDALHELADEIREVFSERGHRIDQATGLDKSFRRGRGPQSALSRNMVLDAIDDHAGQLGISRIPVSGGGYDLQVYEGNADRRFRVRKATKNRETEEFEVIVDSASILDIESAEPESLFRHERWIFGYTTDDTGLVSEIFAARARAVRGDIILKLVLTDVTLLGVAGGGTNDGKFVGDDEDRLPGFESDTDDDTGFAGGTGA